MFFGNSIVIGKSKYLGNLEGKIFPKFLREFHGGQRISAVAVGDELEVFRKLCEPPERHAHGKDTGTDAPIVGYLVADDGAAGGIHNKPDIGFDAADLDVGLIGNKSFSFLIRILVNKGFDADGCGFAVVCDLLVGDVDVVEVFEGLSGLT